MNLVARRADIGFDHAVHHGVEVADPCQLHEIVFFAYYNQEPIGFFVTVPDLNRLIGKFRGKFGLWQKLRLMWDLKVRRKCDRIFGIIFGIAPEFHGKGVESAIMAEYWKYLDRTAARSDARR